MTLIPIEATAHYPYLTVEVTEGGKGLTVIQSFYVLI